MKKKLIMICMSAIFVLTAAFASMACTGTYVGKKVSSNGTAIIGRTRDSSIMDSVCRRVVHKASDEEGRVYTELNGFTFDLPDTTYRYISGPLSKATGRGTFGASCINSEGLAITATVTGIGHKEAVDADPYVSDGICEACIGDITAMCCGSAEEAVEFLGRLMETKGSAESNIIMVADADEVWYMEMYTGHQWAAIKMPEDKAAVFGNSFMLDPVNETYDSLKTSKDIEKLAKEKGFAVYTEDGRFDLFNSYCGRENLATYSTMRTWYGQYTLGNNKENYEESRKYPLFFEPEKKLGVYDISELYRSRYEGTEFCPDENGRKDMRIIGTERQYSVDITEIHDDLPKEMSVVSWVCLDNAEYSPFIPFSNLITDIDDKWSMDFTDRNDYESENCAFYAFQNLNVLAATGRKTYGQGVRAYWRSVEDYLLESFPDTLKKTSELYAYDSDAAAMYMTNYLMYLQQTSVKDAESIKKELLHYMAMNIETFDAKVNDDLSCVPAVHDPFESTLAGNVAERYSVEASPARVETSGLYSWIKKIANYIIKYMFNKKSIE